MKTHRLSLIVLALAIATSLPAAGSKAVPNKGAQQENTPEWAEVFGGASLPVVWQSATASAAKIEQAVKTKSFEGVADWAETIHLASHALVDQVKLEDAQQLKRLNGALGQAAKIADGVLDAANHKDAAALADSFRRMNAALKLAASRLPREITEAPPQKVRFAKAAAHSHDESGAHTSHEK